MAEQVTSVCKTVKVIRDAGVAVGSLEALIGVAVGLAESVDELTAAGAPVPAALWKELRSAAETLARAANEVGDGAASGSDDAVSLPKMGD